MKWLFFFSLIQYLSDAFCDSCSVNLDDILALKNLDPLYIKNGSLNYPGSEIIGQTKVVKFKWDEGEIGSVVCSDENYIKGYQTSEIIFECRSGNKLIDVSTNKNIDPKKLKCTSEIIPSVVNTEKNCETGMLLQIGFKNGQQFITAFDVCYNFDSGSVRYTKHTIAGQSRKADRTSHDRSTYLKDGLPHFTREGEPFNKHRERFSDIVESSTSTKKAFGVNPFFLARGHLTPVADGIFNSWKRATMFYVNMAPEWQAINACNWKRVENIARTMAFALNDYLEVTTGIAGVLKMRNGKSNQDEELYLTTKTIQNEIIENRKEREQKSAKKHLSNTHSHSYSNTIPIETDENLIVVPKYYWKVLKYNEQHIAFITLNNPYGINESDVCDDICKENGYPTVDKKDKTKGFHYFRGGRTYCCTVANLVKEFPNDVPDYLKSYTGNVLQYKHSDKIVPEPTDC